MLALQDKDFFSVKVNLRHQNFAAVKLKTSRKLLKLSAIQVQISELELTVRDPSTLPSNATHTKQQNCHELAGN